MGADREGRQFPAAMSSPLPNDRKINMAANLSPSASRFQGIKVIDTDTHITEPHDLWTKRAPGALRERVPQVKVINGKRAWVVDGDKSIHNMGMSASPSSVILKDGSKPKGQWFKGLQIEDVHAGSYDAKARVKLMDEMGIWAQIVYPNVLGFGGQNAVKVDHELRLAITQIFNDAMAEMQAESGQRMFPMALLPWWDVQLAVRETERCLNMGMRGININSDPHHHADPRGNKLPGLSDPYWNPLWELCEHHRAPINFHIGASEATMSWGGTGAWPELDLARNMLLTATMLYTNNSRVMANVMISGMLDRFPGLRFVSVESGLGWIPFVLESLEYQLEEYSNDIRLELTPTEYFKRNFHATFWFEKREQARVIRLLGVENVMFETDIPHPVCLYPDALQRVAEGLSSFDDASCRKILSGNAAKLYSIPV
jgi:predicted TIM-barrel fold metal-dependent hydrolase